MTTVVPPPARLIVYRHACECPTASTAPHDDGEHRFDVDGKPFPWLLTEAGPSIVRFGPNHYQATVEILAVDPQTLGWVDFRHTMYQLPELGGHEFPWLLTGPITYTAAGPDEVPVLRLTFFADAVDADCDIPDADGIS